jgi:hypothetical protein
MLHINTVKQSISLIGNRAGRTGGHLRNDKTFTRNTWHINAAIP